METKSNTLEKRGRGYALVSMIIAIVCGALSNLLMSSVQRETNIDALSGDLTPGVQVCSEVKLGGADLCDGPGDKLNLLLHGGGGLRAIAGQLFFPEREFFVTRLINAEFVAATEKNTTGAENSQNGSDQFRSGPQVPFFAPLLGLEQMICYGLVCFGLVQLRFLSRRVKIEHKYLKQIDGLDFLLSESELRRNELVSLTVQQTSELAILAGKMEKEFVDDAKVKLGSFADYGEFERSKWLELSAKTLWGGAYLAVCDAIRSGGRQESAKSAVALATDASTRRINSIENHIPAIQFAIPSIGFLGSLRGMIGAFQTTSGPDALSSLTSQLGIAFYSSFVAIGLGLILVWYRTIVIDRREILFSDVQEKIGKTMTRHLPH